MDAILLRKKSAVIHYWEKYEVNSVTTYTWNRWNLVSTTTYRWNKWSTESEPTTSISYSSGTVSLVMISSGWVGTANAYSNPVPVEFNNRLCFRCSKPTGPHIGSNPTFPVALSGWYYSNNQLSSNSSYYWVLNDLKRLKDIIDSSYDMADNGSWIATYDALLTAVNGYKKGTTSYGQVTSTSSSAYPSNGVSGSYWYESAGSSTSYSKGSTQYSDVTSTNPNAYPNGSYSGSYWYDNRTSNTTHSMGSYIEDIFSTDPNKYPANGISGSFWYVYQGQL